MIVITLTIQQSGDGPVSVAGAAKGIGTASPDERVYAMLLAKLLHEGMPQLCKAVGGTVQDMLGDDPKND